MNVAPAVWVIIVVLLVALLVALAALAVLWRRARAARADAAPLPLDVAQLQAPMFAAAMAALYPRDADNRYDKPYVLVCGAGASGKSDLLRGAGMEPVEALAGKDSGWWRSSEGIAFELPAAAWDAHAGPWTDFLRLIDRHRPRRGLDAVVWTIPFAALQDGSADGDRMYRKFVDIQHRLGLRLPVYVVVTGCDGAEGFAPWAARLPQAVQAQPLGWSNPNAPGTAWRPQDGEQAAGRLLQRMRRLVSALAAQDDLDGAAAAVFALPERLAAGLARLPRTLQEAMRQNAVLTPFDLRGFYLSGRAGTGPADPAPPADPFDAFAPAAPVPSAPAPLFGRDLFANRVFGEFGLATLVQRRLNAERRTRLAVLGGAGLFAAVWLVALVPTYFAARAQLETIRVPLAGAVGAVRDARSRADGASGPRFDAHATVELLREMDAVQDWSTRRAALPLSWSPCCGGLRDEIDTVLRTYYSDVLFKQIDTALAERATSLTSAKTGAPGPAGELAAQPDQTNQYQALNKFLDETLEYEFQRRRFAELASPNGGSWKATAGLAEYLFDVRLADASPATAARFDTVLRQSSYDSASRDDLRDRGRFAARLRQLHAAFTDSAFADNRLLRLQRELVDGVGALQHAPAEEPQRLAALQKDIGELHALLSRTNAVWMADGRLTASDAYRALDTKIRTSRYLGDRLANELRDDAGAKQSRFRTGVDADSTGTYPILAYTEGKQLAVNPDLEGLQAALGQLLQHRFAQGAADAMPPDPDVPLAWNVERLGATRDVLTELNAWETAELVKAPVPYQPILRRLARAQAAALVEQELAGAAGPVPCDVPWRCANFDEARVPLGDVVGALRKLELDVPAERWQRVADRQALALLRALDAAVDAAALYLPDPRTVSNWNGTRGSAYQAYGVRAAAELQDVLDSQLQLVADLALAGKGPRAWLAQAGARAPREAQRLLTQWARVDTELAKHAAKAPTGSLRRLEQFVAEDLATLDAGNCAERLGRMTAPDADLFQRRVALIAASYRPHCIALEGRALRDGYQRIADHYTRHLLNRYPFASARDAAPADPDDVRALLRLLDTHLATLRTTLARRTDPQSAAALAFVERLAAVQPVLAALLAEDPAGGPVALDLWPQFRVNRTRERGAEQIIEWNVHAGDALPPPAPGGAPGSAWRMGQPIDMTLRWARNSPVTPAATPARPDVRVDERTVRWQYDDPWALLHLLGDHAAPLSDLGERDARAPVVLRFVVPTRDAAGAPVADTVAYARLGVSVHGKPERLAVPAFPAHAAPPLPGEGLRLAAGDGDRGNAR